MSRTIPIGDLVIRTAVVRTPQVGYLICGDRTQEAEDVPHAITFRWNSGSFTRGDRNYMAHAECCIEKPAPGLVDVSGQGYYSVITQQGMTSGDILTASKPPTKTQRTGGIRSVASIGGRAHAVGLRGIVYRLDSLDSWTRIDEGLPQSFDGQAIDGFDQNDLYAAGRKGELWHYDGDRWTACQLPTNANLTSVHCAGDAVVYVAGHKGTIVRGRDEAWQAVDQDETRDDFWDIQWFKEKLYLSTMYNVYEFIDEGLAPVDFGKDIPKSCYQLSASPDVMWSNGELDIMAFDGDEWTRVV